MNRKEFLFVYESIFANANGDPLNDNHPRIDEEIGTQYVTMYRIKRTIRDYLKLLHTLKDEEGSDILHSKRTYKKNEKEYLKPIEMVIKDETDLTMENILKMFIDFRLFGGFLGKQDNKIELQGPVQVSYGQSYHKVRELEVEMSTVVPNSEGKTVGTFGTSYIVPYALIGVDGTVNQYNAEKALLTEKDVELMFRALWEGTAELKTTSKNQKPLLLINVEFKKECENAYIGNFKNYLKLAKDKEDTELRSINDFSVDVSDLTSKLNNMGDKIEKIFIKKDAALEFVNKGQPVDDIRQLFNAKVELQVV